MTDLRDWKEDNALAHISCERCGHQFIGNEKRTMCRVCNQWLTGPVQPEGEKPNAATPSQ